MIIVALLCALSYAQTDSTPVETTLPASDTGTSAYSVEGPQSCIAGVGGGSPTSTEKTCVDGVLTLSDWYSGSTDCTGTPDDTYTITDLGTCKINDDLVSNVKTTIECTDTTVKATTCGDDVGIICTTNDVGYVRGCTKEQCAELCCRRNSNYEAYVHAYWSEWSMKGECLCGTEAEARTRKTEDNYEYLAENGGSIAEETCATWTIANDGEEDNEGSNDSGAICLSISGILAAALLWTFA